MIDYIAGLFPLMAVFCVLVVSANIEISDLDLWLHLAMGKFIALHGYIPDVDVLSNSIAGKPWVNHEWLFQVIVYRIYETWGASGLITMQVAVVSLTMLFLLILGYSKEKQLLTAFILLLLYLVFQQRFTIRPDIYSLLFFSIYIFVLSLHIDKKWAAPVICMVQVLWCNMHGFFFFGPLFIMIGIVSEFVKRHARLPYEWNDSGRLTDDEYRRMKWTLILAVLACLVNPTFIEGAWYPVKVFFSLGGDSKIFFSHIQELQKPITWETLFDLNRQTHYKMLIGLSALSFFFNRRRIDISALLFWLVFLVFSLKAVRNVSFFAFAAYLVFITNLMHIRYDDIIPIRFTEKKFFYLTSAICKLLFVIWVIGYYQDISQRSYYDFDRYELKSVYGGLSQRTYPNKGADFLVDNKIKGNFFNDFNSGAYLLGRTYPDIKVFIDGRTEVYGGKFFSNYLQIWEKGNVQLFDGLVEKYHITGAFLNSTRHHIPGKLLKHLYENGQWRLVYLDYDAVIFLKDVPLNKGAIDRFELDPASWRAPEIDLYRLGTLRVKPYQPYYRAFTLESLGFFDAALTELENAIKVDPLYPDAHDLMGKIYAQRKDFKTAFEHFRIAVSIVPGSKEKLHNLALAYYDLEKLEEAVKQYERIIHKWPEDPKGHYLLSKSLIKSGQFDQAMDSLRTAHQLSPNDLNDVLALGDLFLEEQALDEALASYRMALKTGKEPARVQKKIGDALTALKDMAGAKAAYEKALSIEPDNQEILNTLKIIR